MRMAHTATAKILLMVASRINTPAKTLTAMIENGLTTSYAVKQNKSGNERHGKYRQPAQSTGQKYGFSCKHISLHSLAISTEHRI